MLDGKVRRQHQPVEFRQRRTAMRIMLITFVLMLAIAVVNAFFIPNEDKTPIDNYTMPLLALSAGLSYLLALRGNHTGGTYVLLGSIALTGLLYPFAADNVGWQAAIGMLVIVTSIAASSLPSIVAGRLSAAAFLLAIVIIVIELYVEGSTHIPVTTSAVVITGALSIVYISLLLVRFNMFSLRAKLITAFIVVSMVSVGAVAFTISRSVLGQLTGKVEREVSSIANLTASSIAAELHRQADLLRSLALSGALHDELRKVNASATDEVSELERRAEQWRAADATGNDADPLVQLVLTHAFSDELRKLQSAFPEHLEVFVTDRSGVNVAASSRISEYFHADEDWWQTAHNGGQGSVFIGQPDFDRRNQTLAIMIAVPVIDPRTRNAIGIMGTTVDFNVFSTALEAGRLGQTGRTEIYLPNDMELELERQANGGFEMKLEEAAPDLAAALRQGQAIMHTTHDGVPVLFGQSTLFRADAQPEELAALDQLSWRVVTMQDRAEALQLVAEATRTAQLVGIGAVLLAGLLAVGVAQILTRPILELTHVAEKVSTGDLQTRAEVSSSDEIGVLAASFNRMTNRLTEALGSLEQRVAERTDDLNQARALSEQRAQELQSIGEISRLISSEQRLDILLPLTTRLVSERFDFYHVGIFLLDSTGSFAILQAANSEGGQRMLERGFRLEVGQTSITGSVAETGQARIALGTGNESAVFDNPELPGTRSEMALPLNIRGETIGVLDVQSKKPDEFTETDANILGILADHIAITIKNARLFEQTQQALSEAQSLYTQFLRREWLSFSSRTSSVGYYKSAIGGQHVEVPIQSDEILAALQRGQVVVLNGTDSQSRSSIAMPVKLRGQPIGVLNIRAPMRSRKWSEDEINLVQAISDRLALALDNARLLEESQRRAAKEAKIGEVTAKIGASINIRNVLETAVEELGHALPGSEVIIQFEPNGAKNEERDSAH